MKEADGAKVLTTRSVEFGIENVRLEFRFNSTKRVGYQRHLNCTGLTTPLLASLQTQSTKAQKQ
jgi:hypothetical protein